MAPRTHASAARRAFTTSASCTGARSRTTVPARSMESKVSMTVATNSLCFFGERHSMCALRTTLINVSSTEGGGISSKSDGVRLTKSGTMHTPTTPPWRPEFMCCGIFTARKPKDSRTGRVNHAPCGRRLQPAARIGDAVGRADGSTPSPRTARLPLHTEKAGLAGPSLLFAIPGGAASQAVRNPFRLPEGLGFTSPSRLRKRIKSPVDNPPVCKTDGYDLGHVVVLKSLSGLEASQ